MYNFLCSALSLYSLGVIVKAYYHGGILYTFAMEHDADVKHAFLIYLITKHLELLDTVFMIIRHRQRQITFLHVSCSPFCMHAHKEVMWCSAGSWGGTQGALSDGVGKPLQILGRGV